MKKKTITVELIMQVDNDFYLPAFVGIISGTTGIKITQYKIKSEVKGGNEAKDYRRKS